MDKYSLELRYPNSEGKFGTHNIFLCTCFSVSKVGFRDFLICVTFKKKKKKKKKKKDDISCELSP